MKSTFLGSYELFQKYKSSFSKCYHEPYSSKEMKIQNLKEIAYLEYLPVSPNYPFISRIEVRKKINKKSSTYCVSLNTNENFITNKFKIKIGDSYNSIIGKLNNITYNVNNSNIKTVIKISMEVKGVSYYFESESLKYEAQYFFSKNKLTSYILSLHM